MICSADSLANNHGLVRELFRFKFSIGIRETPEHHQFRKYTNTGPSCSFTPQALKLLQCFSPLGDVDQQRDVLFGPMCSLIRSLNGKKLRGGRQRNVWLNYHLLTDHDFGQIRRANDNRELNRLVKQIFSVLLDTVHCLANLKGAKK